MSYIKDGNEAEKIKNTQRVHLGKVWLIDFAFDKTGLHRVSNSNVGSYGWIKFLSSTRMPFSRRPTSRLPIESQTLTI